MPWHIQRQVGGPLRWKGAAGGSLAQWVAFNADVRETWAQIPSVSLTDAISSFCALGFYT